MADKTTTAPKAEAKKAETATATTATPKKESTAAATEKADEVCRAFRNTSNCRFGDECKYLHSEGDPIEPPPRDYTPRGECHNFRDKKECRFGDRCRFVHGDGDKRNTYRPERKKDETATITGTDGSEKQICRNFQRRGKCRFGDKCRHVHVATERKEAAKGEKKTAPKGETKKPIRPKKEGKTGGGGGGGGGSSSSGSSGGGAGAGADRDDEKKRRRNRRRKVEKGEKLVLTDDNKFDSEGIELCRNFRNKKGKCRFGEDCTFSHAPGGPIGQPAGERPPREPRTGAARVPGLCYNWRDEQSCEFGDECRFKHGDGDKRDFSSRPARGARKSASS